MADFSKDKDHRMANMTSVTLLVVDRYSSRTARSERTGEACRRVSVEVLATVGANGRLRKQGSPALNSDDSGRPLQLWYPESVLAAVSVAAARGPGGAAQQVKEGGRVVGAAYVFTADVVPVRSASGAHVAPSGRYDLRIDPESIVPAPINVLIPRDVVAKQALCARDNAREIKADLDRALSAESPEADEDEGPSPEIQW